MEEKIEVLRGKTTYLMHDRYSGAFIRTTSHRFMKIQMELNKKLEKADGVMTLNEYWSIISRDWPKKERQKFLKKCSMYLDCPPITNVNDPKGTYFQMVYEEWDPQKDILILGLRLEPPYNWKEP